MTVEDLGVFNKESEERDRCLVDQRWRGREMVGCICESCRLLEGWIGNDGGGPELIIAEGEICSRQRNNDGLVRKVMQADD